MAKPKENATIDIPVVRRRLLRWYKREKRDLPWRQTSDPYRIWVSEIMLQQTRVEAVIPYYRNFLRQFPAVGALAKAPEERLLRAWSGLGYYARARNMHQAAKVMVSAHDGEFPRGLQPSLALPGVGPYTAAAILSIAYNMPLAALDGNVARVLSRLYKLAVDIRDGRGKTQLSKRASELLDLRHPGDFNQAMMELGATVCLPAKPRCSVCPLRRDCLAHASSEVANYPPLRARAKDVPLKLIAAIVQDPAGRILLEKRAPDANWMPGFWEIPTWVDGVKPHGIWEGQFPPRDDISLGKRLGTVRHSITRFRIEVDVRLAMLSHEDRLLRGSAILRWASLQEIRQIPLTTITRKALNLQMAEC
jgi:A/G-specific adenine glycosylase